MIECNILYMRVIITLYCFSIPHEHTYLSASHIINSQAISCTTNQHPSFSNLIFCNYFIHLITSLTI